MRFSVGPQTGNSLSMGISNAPMLVPVYWATPPTGAFQTFDYESDFGGHAGAQYTTLNGHLVATVGYNVGFQMTTERGLETSQQYNNAEIADGRAYWSISRDAWNPATQSHTAINLGAPVDMDDIGAMASVCEGMAHLVQSFNASMGHQIRANNYRPYPEVDCWTLEQYSPQIDMFFSRSIWYAKESEQDRQAGAVHNPINLPTGYQQPSAFDHFGAYMDYDGSVHFHYFPCFQTRVSVNRYPEGQTLAWADLNVEFTGSCEFAPPASWQYSSQGENYFVTTTIPQPRGSTLDIAASVDAYQLSLCLNIVDHTTTGPWNAMLFQQPNCLALNYGPATILDFNGTDLDGARFALARSGVVSSSPGAFSSGLAYTRFGCGKFKVTKVNDDFKVTIGTDGGDYEATVAMSEIGFAPQLVSDLRIGRYFHGGYNQRIQFSAPKW